MDFVLPNGIDFVIINKDEKEVCNNPLPCNAYCTKLQKGECTLLSIDEIKSLLDETDWDTEDKGEVMMEYLIKEI